MSSFNFSTFNVKLQFLNFQCQALRMAHINSTTSRLCCSPLLFDHQVLMFGLHQICKLPISSRSILLKFQEYFVWKSFLREAELLEVSLVKLVAFNVSKLSRAGDISASQGSDISISTESWTRSNDQNREKLFLQLLRMVSRVHQKSKKFSKSHGLLIYFVPTWVQAISAKKMIFFAFSSLGHHVEKNGPCSRENEVKISKNRFLAIKSCRNMLQPSSQHC